MNYLKIGLLALLLSVAGCQSSAPTEFEQLKPYYASYVGDNSAMGAIVHLTPGSDYFKQMALTETSITLSYEAPPITSKEQQEAYNRWKPERAFAYNAAVFFLLVQNLETITFEWTNDLGMTDTYVESKEAFFEAYPELHELASERLMEQYLEKAHTLFHAS